MATIAAPTISAVRRLASLGLHVAGDARRDRAVIAAPISSSALSSSSPARAEGSIGSQLSRSASRRSRALFSWWIIGALLLGFAPTSRRHGNSLQAWRKGGGTLSIVNSSGWRTGRLREVPSRSEMPGVSVEAYQQAMA